MADLTAERLRQLVKYDPETGVFTRIANTGRWKAGEIVGSNQGGGYLEACIGGKVALLHRFAWFYMTGSWPADRIDHKNRDRADNRWANLRETDSSLNQANRAASIRSRSGVKGVSLCKATGRWAAFITVRGKSIRLGRFASKEEASQAYATAAMHHFGEFARA